MKFGLAAALVLAFAACGGKSDDRPATSRTTGTAVASDAGVEDPSCNTHSTTEKRADIPAGACASGATCAFQTPAGRESCVRGQAAYALTPDEWKCNCDGTWHCEVVAGSFGLGVCPGWEQGETCAMGDTCGPVWCKANEACFTSVACGPRGPSQDAGTICRRADGAGDDTCHRVCTTDTDCPTAQECVEVDFWGCGDFNGASQNDHLKKICCAAGSNCQAR